MATHVLLVNFEYPPIAGPGIWRVYALSRDLDALGYQVTVVCSDRSGWHELRDEELATRIPPGVTVRRVVAPLLRDWEAGLAALAGRRGPGAVRTLLVRLRRHLQRVVPDPAFVWAWRAIRTARHELQSRGPETGIIITSGPPHVSHVVGLAAKRLTRCRWIMDYRDAWTADPVHVHAGPYQARLFRWLERRCLARCDEVVTVAPSWQRQLIETGLAAGRADAEARTHLIRNGHDLSPEVPTRPPADVSPRLHLHFSGTLQTGTRVAADIVLQALSLLARRLPPGQWPRLTFTGFRRNFAERLAALDIQELVTDVGYRSHREALALSAAADVLLVLVDQAGPVQSGIVPAKIYEAIGLGSHVLAIAPDDGDAASLLTEYGNATVCGDGDVAAVAAALQQLVERHRADPSGWKLRGPRLDEWRARCSRKASAEAYAGLIDGVMARPR